MPSVTSTILEPGKSRITALMGLSQGNEDYAAILEGTFNTDEYRQEQFRDRITIKDYAITGLLSEKDIAKKEEIERSYKKEPPEWLLNKVSPPYTSEYIAIKRKEYISNVIEQIQNIKSTLGDNTSLQMYLAIMKNEINTIYKTFLETCQDEHFLSIISLLEDIFNNNKLDKKILKECNSLLKSIKDKDVIEYGDYEMTVRKFFEMGVDMISIKEIPNEE